MDTSEIAVFHLISVALFNAKLDLTRLTNVEWSKVFSLSCSHGVAAICFDAFEQIPKEFLPDRSLLLQWIGVVNMIENGALKRKKVLDKIVQYMEGSSICVYLLKGDSLSGYYPNPLHRVSTDIDVYLGEKFEEGNSILDAIGAKRVEAYHRHTSYVYDGISIENHCMLSDTKGRKDNVKLEKKLVEIAATEMNGKCGLVFPSNSFSTLFVSWHNESHFMFEGLTIRHLCDWAMLLRSGFEDVDMEEFLQQKRDSSFGKLMDVLTAIILRIFDVSADSTPQVLVESARRIPTTLSNRVLNDILGTNAEKMLNRNKTPLMIKLALAKRMFNDRWKFKEVFEINVWKVMMSKFLSSFE